MNFLHNENIIEIIFIVLIIIGSITIFYAFITLISLFKQIRIHLKNKSIIEYNKLTKPNILATDEQVEVTKEILSLINTLIEIECNVTMKTFITLNQKYEYTRLSDDINIISTNVYEGLDKKLIFDNPNIFLTNDYIMKYISQQTSIILLANVIQFNADHTNNTIPSSETP